VFYMKLVKTIVGAALGAWISAATVTSANAQQIITLDENGNGYITSSLPFAYSITTEPISGISTLRYNLPFAGVAGDVKLVSSGGALSDLLRFDGAGHVWFFSDIGDGGAVTLADVALLPTPSANAVTLFEQLGSYTPYTPNGVEPGYKSAGPIGYRFITEVPEPASIALAGLGLLCLVRFRRS
jgi:hypothetical protein